MHHSTDPKYFESFQVIPAFLRRPAGNVIAPCAIGSLYIVSWAMEFGAGSSEETSWKQGLLDVSGLVLFLSCLYDSDFLYLFVSGRRYSGCNSGWFRVSTFQTLEASDAPAVRRGILQLLQAPVRLVFFLRLCHVQSLNNNIQECVRQLTHSMAWRTSKARQRGNASVTGPDMHGVDCQLTMQIYIYIYIHTWS